MSSNFICKIPCSFFICTNFRVFKLFVCVCLCVYIKIYWKMSFFFCPFAWCICCMMLLCYAIHWFYKETGKFFIVSIPHTSMKLIGYSLNSFEVFFILHVCFMFHVWGFMIIPSNDIVSKIWTEVFFWEFNVPTVTPNTCL